MRPKLSNCENRSSNSSKRKINWRRSRQCARIKEGQEEVAEGDEGQDQFRLPKDQDK